MGLKKEIIKFDLNGNEICRYSSVQDAVKAEGISENKIYKVINGKQKAADGWIFKKSGNVTNAVDKFTTGEYKCPYCEKRFKTYEGMAKHVVKSNAHGEISSEQLLVDFKYQGIRPTCACGCGEYTSIDKNGEYSFRQYVYGHGIRVHNNWGHNKAAQEKSAETRRRQYKEGTRVQWNKGKKWEEVYNQDMISKLMSSIKSQERAKKIRNKLIGVPKSEEHAEKCRYNGSCERTRKILSKKLHDRLDSGEFSISSYGEKQFITEFIEPLGLEYKKQYFLREINQYCDIYIPSKNLIIEYDGDFWHCNPERYPIGALYEYQKRHIEKDKIKNEYCKNKGIILLRIWESDASKNKQLVKQKILDAIK
jgi:very-short-patch-repair endonuclease/uncharacterized Zn finger protein (UPF0148 family)